MRFRSLGQRAKIISGSLVPLVLVGILSVTALISVRALLRGMENVNFSSAMIRETVNLVREANEMKAAMRGYLNTNQNSYLEAYTAADRSVQKQLQEVKKSVGGNREQSKTVDMGSEALNEWKIKAADPQIALRREIGETKGLQELADFVVKMKGWETFDRFTAKVQALIDAQKVMSVQQEKTLATVTDEAKLKETVQDSERNRVVLGLASNILLTASAADRHHGSYLLTGQQQFHAAYENRLKHCSDLLDELRKAVSDDSSQVQLLKEASEFLTQWNRLGIAPEVELRKEMSGAKSLADLDQMIAKGDDEKYFSRFIQVMNDFEKTERDRIDAQQKAAAATGGVTQKIMAGGTVAVIVVSLIISVVLSAAITRPISQAVALAESISRGDLTQRVAVKGKDDVGRLSAALNAMVEHLRDNTRKILDGVSVLASSATGIASTVSQLSESTGRTAAAVTETTTTVQQVKHAAKISSEKAQRVAERSQQAVSISQSGRSATEDTLGRMNLIKNKMESIGETVGTLSENTKTIEGIITAVQDLAEQSNLLAVNASIEAARAGEQGKGFAVVAHEIKSLADQSRDATRQVREILDEIRKSVTAVVLATEEGGKAVDAGVEKSADAEESIRALATSVGESAQAAEVIVATSEQQFIGVDQVSLAVESIGLAMQQTVAGTTQLGAEARRLEQLGTELTNIVGSYKL